ncbi:RNA polymerase sigma factor [Motilibacter peucedani]|uniref:RNA polymerase sigma factor n=1 Tax=Motilibacter peucedani TaxID=598650 RepID=UPI000EAEDC92|nr:sigma-70 family RNA polymerase sigma factor [Motilibacter peucedani]
MTSDCLRDGADDAAVWSAVRGGSAGAFAVVFDRHSRGVYNALYRRTGSWDAAEELTGAVFLVAWQRRHDRLAGGDETLLPWLLKIAAHVASNAERSRRRYEAAVARLPAEPDVDPTSGADERLDASRVAAALAPALRALPAEQLAAVHALADHGDQAAAARALGVPAGTFTSRLSRARGRLRNASPDAAPKDSRHE